MLEWFAIDIFMDNFFPFVTAASVAEGPGCKGEKEKLKLTTTNSDVPPYILIRLSIVSCPNSFTHVNKKGLVF